MLPTHLVHLSTSLTSPLRGPESCFTLKGAETEAATWRKTPQSKPTDLSALCLLRLCASHQQVVGSNPKTSSKTLYSGGRLLTLHCTTTSSNSVLFLGWTSQYTFNLNKFHTFTNLVFFSPFFYYFTACSIPVYLYSI